ncbi:hypothetical protein B0H11DRAFT_1698042 [Mycena galericulata]|nr:hypothetical protein B0H11DRAFT_1698042 [Mycena galericulata]
MNFSRLWPSRITNAYELLPVNPHSSHESQHPSLARRRGLWPRGVRARGITLLVLLSLVAAGFWSIPTSTGIDTEPSGGSEEPVTPPPPRPPPPLYEEYHERERNLPQHNMSLPYPEGSHAKFLWAANHGDYFGWGNYMQEMILNSYLAYSAHRAYVFDNYTWRRDGPDIDNYNGKLIPARIPLSVFISGPIIGGPMPNKDVPRAVSREYFLSICPESERVVIDTRTIQNTLGADPTVRQIVDRWVTELNSIDSPCVELARYSPALFSYEITNTIRVLDVFPDLSESPILSDFAWSALILQAFNDNFKFFGLPTSSPPANSTAPLKGLLAIHVRRGDYETWCDDAYKNTMSYTGFNSFPSLPDKYAPGSHTTPDDTRKHCLPSIPEIVAKVLSVNKPHITRVYVMTNAPRAWLDDLTRELRFAHTWADGVGTSRDLELSWEVQFVSQAVDMYVGQRADMFIGNGFSSLTSNIVMMRMHDPELDPLDTHFW